MHLERAASNSLNERFRVPSGIRTRVALWLDDDVQISPTAIEFAFRAWRNFGSPQHRVTGFAPRHYQRDVRSLHYRYAFDGPRYSMVLTDSAFLDLTMLDWYWEDEPAKNAARHYVSKHMNCEDILMNCKPEIKSGRQSEVKGPAEA